MSLRTSSVSRCLDRKFRVLGFEAPDLLALLLTTGTLKVIFTGTGLELYFVWIPAAAAAVSLRLIKRGKPDDFLKHLIRFHFLPKNWMAFQGPTKWNRLPRLPLNRNHQDNFR